MQLPSEPGAALAGIWLREENSPSKLANSQAFGLMAGGTAAADLARRRGRSRVNEAANRGGLRL
jgi:hypothetical protein